MKAALRQEAEKLVPNFEHNEPGKQGLKLYNYANNIIETSGRKDVFIHPPISLDDIKAPLKGLTSLIDQGYQPNIEMDADLNFKLTGSINDQPQKLNSFFLPIIDSNHIILLQGNKLNEKWKFNYLDSMGNYNNLMERTSSKISEYLNAPTTNLTNNIHNWNAERNSMSCGNWAIEFINQSTKDNLTEFLQNPPKAEEIKHQQIEKQIMWLKEKKSNINENLISEKPKTNIKNYNLPKIETSNKKRETNNNKMSNIDKKEVTKQRPKIINEGILPTTNQNEKPLILEQKNIVEENQVNERSYTPEKMLDILLSTISKNPEYYYHNNIIFQDGESKMGMNHQKVDSLNGKTLICSPASTENIHNILQNIGNQIHGLNKIIIPVDKAAMVIFPRHNGAADIFYHDPMPNNSYSNKGNQLIQAANRYFVHPQTLIYKNYNNLPIGFDDFGVSATEIMRIASENRDAWNFYHCFYQPLPNMENLRYQQSEIYDKNIADSFRVKKDVVVEEVKEEKEEKEEEIDEEYEKAFEDIELPEPMKEVKEEQTKDEPPIKEEESKKPGFFSKIGNSIKNFAPIKAITNLFKGKKKQDDKKEEITEDKKPEPPIEQKQPDIKMNNDHVKKLMEQMKKAQNQQNTPG